VKHSGTFGFMQAALQNKLVKDVLQNKVACAIIMQ
jgi:hypothetical protein